MKISLSEKNKEMPGRLPLEASEGRRWIPKPLSARRRTDFPIVAIGASAGGLDACKKLLDALPASSGMAPVSYTHLDVYKRQL